MTKKRVPNRYEKQIRLGNYDKYTFPNYFTSQKARAKITKQEETDGNKLFLGLQDKKEKLKNGPAQKSKSKSKKLGRKGYQTELDSYDSQNEQMESYDEHDVVKSGDKKDKDDTHIKHKPHKNEWIGTHFNTKKGCDQKSTFDKMKYMLDCGFNLMVYGVGSRYKLLNLFIQRQLTSKHPVI